MMPASSLASYHSRGKQAQGLLSSLLFINVP